MGRMRLKLFIFSLIFFLIILLWAMYAGDVASGMHAFAVLSKQTSPAQSANTTSTTSKSGPGPGPRPGPRPGPGPEAGPGPGPEAGTGPEAGPRPGPEAGPGPRPGAGPGPRPGAGPRPRPGPEAGPGPRPRPEAGPGPRPGPGAGPEPGHAKDFTQNTNSKPEQVDSSLISSQTPSLKLKTTKNSVTSIQESSSKFDPNQVNNTDPTPTKQKTSVENVFKETEEMQQIQKERKRTMHEHCRRVNRHTDLSHALRKTQILVDDANKVLFCVIPKVSGTSWKRKFLGMTGQVEASVLDSQLVRWDSFLEKQGIYFLSSNAYNMSQVRQRIDQYDKYIFVRHPFDRLVSAFLDKFGRGNPHKGYQMVVGRQILRRFRRNATAASLRSGNDVKFSEFVQYLIAGDQTGRTYEHWASYDKLCLPCVLNYDYIGRFDTYGTDMQAIVHRIWPKEPFWFPKPRKSRPKETMERMFQTVSLDLRKTLMDVYLDDFKMFNYSLPQIPDNNLTESTAT